MRGVSYNGAKFKGDIQSFDMEELIEASVQVPTEVQERINGLVVLLYLSAKFRETQSLRKGRRAASMCLALLRRNAYSYLLGAHGEYRSVDDCFAYATSKIYGVLRNYLTKNLTRLKAAFHDELEDLKTKRLVKKRVSNYRVEGLRTPENWLRKDP